MEKIVLIAPSQEIADNAVAAKKEYQLEMDVCLGLMESAYEMEVD